VPEPGVPEPASDENEEYGTFPLGTHLGIEIESPEPGRAIARTVITAEHLNPNGVVHGGVIFTMVDTAMGMATMTLLEEGRFCASIEVQLRFLRPVDSGVLEADTTVLRRGSRVVQLESRVHDDQRRLVATGSGSFAVITL